MLRVILLVLGFLSLIVAAVLARDGNYPPAAWLAINGLVLTAGIVFERWRYKPSQKPHSGAAWQSTGEKFIDPASGKLVEVMFDPESGERRYVDASGRP